MTAASGIEILLVEDAEAHAELIARAFEPTRDRFRLRFARLLAEARVAIADHVPDLVIADHQLPDGYGLELVEATAGYPLVLMTSHGDEALAVEAVKAGALDYVVKDVDTFGELPRVADRVLREWRHIVERRRAEVELRQREVELRHAQKLEAIGRLASGVAHDFNNVLMGIAACTDVAVSKLEPGHPARSYLADVLATARRAASITARLLAFSRAGGGERALVVLDALIAEAAAIARPLLPADIALELRLGAAGATIEGDAGQLEQVLLNLATNARDAMGAGGQLVIATREVLHDGRPHVELTVADTGTGMDEATRARVFEPFFTTKDVGRGTGLGLATVYGIVRQHGGRIEIDTGVGVGTTVRIGFPCAARTAPLDATPAPMAARPAARPRRILLVEDDAVVRAAVRHYLEDAGHQVTEAADADAAREQLGADGFDLVVTDVVLPGGGAQVATAAEAASPGLPVLFMSAHPGAVLVAEGRLPPGAVALQKPFTREDLLTAIDQFARPALLLVEDEPSARFAMTELLGDAGFDVVDAARGSDALAAFARRRFDVVVTDLGLPDLACDELAARLRAIDPAVPILFVTGRARHDPLLHRLLAAPSTGVALKPIDIDALISAIRRLLPGRVGVDPA